MLFVKLKTIILNMIKTWYSVENDHIKYYQAVILVKSKTIILNMTNSDIHEVENDNIKYIQDMIFIKSKTIILKIIKTWYL